MKLLLQTLMVVLSSSIFYSYYEYYMGMLNVTQVLINGTDEYNHFRENLFGLNSQTTDYINKYKSPAIIAVCTTREEVSKALLYAKKHGYKVSIKSGGHSYSAESSSGTFQIDVSRMKKIKIEHDYVYVEPGVTNEDLVQHLFIKDYYITHGLCKDVGIGGHYQTSSAGALTHLYGLGISNIEQFEIILANGTLLTVKKGTEYYKYMVGSVPGGFGVVVSYKINVHRPPFDKMMPYYFVYPYTEDIYTKISTLFAQLTQTVYDQKRAIVSEFIGMECGSLGKAFYEIPEVGDYVGPVENFLTLRGCLAVQFLNLDPRPSDYETFFKPFDAVDHYNFPYNLNPQTKHPGSLMTKLAVNQVTTIPSYYINRGYRYYMKTILFDKPIPQAFMDQLAVFTAEHGSLISYQIFPININTESKPQQVRDQISSTLSDVSYVVDIYYFYKDETEFETVKNLVITFKKETQPLWEWEDKKERYIWMSPNMETNLTHKDDLARYFPDDAVFNNVKRVKAELDPTNLFLNIGEK